MYPAELPARRWFEHYQQLFDTVELNTTFYRLPAATTVEGWAGAARPGFVFAAKLGAFGTHRKKLTDAAEWLPNHFDRIDRLGAHLGPTLVQLPPRWRRNVARLDEFLTAADRLRRGARWAVELRDPSWLDDDVFATLQSHAVALCVHDLIADHPFVLTTNWTYVRFHGPDAVAHPYHGDYGATRLRTWADRFGVLGGDGIDTYAYFNNDWHAAAVRDAHWLRSALAGPARVPSPEAGEEPP